MKIAVERIRTDCWNFVGGTSCSESKINRKTLENVIYLLKIL
jgi:hypothetical protein